MAFVLDNEEVQLVVSDTQPRAALAFNCEDTAMTLIDGVEVRFDRHLVEWMLYRDEFRVEVSIDGSGYVWTLDKAQHGELMDNLSRHCDK